MNSMTTLVATNLRGNLPLFLSRPFAQRLGCKERIELIGIFYHCIAHFLFLILPVQDTSAAARSYMESMKRPYSTNWLMDDYQFA